MSRGETQIDDRYQAPPEGRISVRNFARFSWTLVAGVALSVLLDKLYDFADISRYVTLAGAAAIIVGLIQDILEPKIDSDLDPVLNAAQIARDSRKSRLSGAIALVVTSAFATYLVMELLP